MRIAASPEEARPPRRPVARSWRCWRRYGLFRALLLVLILLIPDVQPIAQHEAERLTLLGVHPASSAVEHSGSGGLLVRYGYALDANGNRTQVAVTGSAVTNRTETYGYDAVDQLTSASYGAGSAASWTYDANGNRTSVTSGATTTTYAYDAADQLTSLGGTSLTYDANGNQLSNGADSFTYDWNNRLTGATVGGASVSYGYLGDGTLVSETAATSASLVYDRVSGLPQLVDDGTASYLRAGPGLAAEVSDATGAAAYPLQDGLGSERLRTDSSGGMTSTGDWDAWGNLRASSGTQGRFGWAGASRDATTGLSALGARAYDPASGRFTSRDSLETSGPGTQGYKRLV